MKTEENLYMITAQQEFMSAALNELRSIDKQLDIVRAMTPDITLCCVSSREQFLRAVENTYPIFVRHIALIQAIVDLNNSEQDIGTLALAVVQLPEFRQLERGTHFSVQTRLVLTDKGSGKRPYSGGQINKMLAEALVEETGAIEDIKKPQIVVSLICTPQKGYIGISPVEENLSSWPGGARHYAQTEEQISRAEFKLLEALEVFGVTLPTSGTALDLGAAPGGWTRILLTAGLHVVAVDPANLDPRLSRQKKLEHYRGYAENYLEDALRKHLRFDIIVNDMRMDAREAARLLAKAARCLRTNDSFVVSVFKLPHETPEIDPLTNLHEALQILKKSYHVVQTHQLFHNRQEVTVVAAGPITTKK